MVNKLMHTLMTYRKHERKNDRGNIEIGYIFIQSYLNRVEASIHYNKLIQDLKVSMECNYFFAGKFAHKSKNDPLAIKWYEKAITIINDKLDRIAQNKTGQTENLHQLEDRLLVLKIRSLYKVSKGNRLLNEKEQEKYESLALAESKGRKYDLHIHISKKIREFKEKKNFKEALGGLESRKKIESEVFKLIEESKKREESLYSFYDDEEDI